MLLRDALLADAFRGPFALGRSLSVPSPLSPAREEPRAFAPAFDVVEEEERIVLVGDLPGVSEASLDLQLTDDVLRISGERTLGRSDAGAHFRRYERPAGTFARTFKLPRTVDGAQISAELKEGVLTVTLPKHKEAQPRQIKVAVKH